MMHLLSITWNFDPVAFTIFRPGGPLLRTDVGGRHPDRRAVLRQLLSARGPALEGFRLPFFVYGTVATIVGARLGHCLFYDTMEYLRQPWTIVTGFRDGGLASHGAAIGLLIGLWLFRARTACPTCGRSTAS